MAIRLMKTNDLAEVKRLCDSFHWPYTEADLARLLELQPNGCFCAQDGGRHLGQAIGVLMRDTGAIGIVGVRQDWRGQGIGTELTRAALDFLLGAGASQVKLDATEMGIRIYRVLGFREMCSIHHFSKRIPAQPVHPASADMSPALSLDQVARLDAEAYGVGRERVLAALARDSEVIGIYRGDEIQGYGMVRATAEPNGIWVGPMVSRDADAGRELLRVVIDRLGGHKVRLGVPEPNQAACRFLEESGFSLDFTITRMYYGDLEPREDPRAIWAEAGHEKG